MFGEEGATHDVADLITASLHGSTSKPGEPILVLPVRWHFEKKNFAVGKSCSGLTVFAHLQRNAAVLLCWHMRQCGFSRGDEKASCETTVNNSE